MCKISSLKNAEEKRKLKFQIIKQEKKENLNFPIVSLFVIKFCAANCHLLFFLFFA